MISYTVTLCVTVHLVVIGCGFWKKRTVHFYQFELFQLHQLEDPVCKFPFTVIIFLVSCSSHLFHFLKKYYN